MGCWEEERIVGSREFMETRNTFFGQPSDPRGGSLASFSTFRFLLYKATTEHSGVLNIITKDKKSPRPLLSILP
jgi:hypothetical protein